MLQQYLLDLFAAIAEMMNPHANIPQFYDSGKTFQKKVFFELILDVTLIGQNCLIAFFEWFM